MFKPRSPFQPPQVPKIEKRKVEMSIENEREKTPSKEESFKSIVCGQKNHSKIKTGPSGSFDPERNLTTGNQYESRFAFDLQEADVDDNTVYWKHTISSQVSNEYLRKLVFRQQEYFVRGVEASGVINTYAIGVVGVPGYLGIDGVQSNILCVLQLASQTATVDDIGIKTYELLYKQTQDIAWDIPMNLSELKYKVYADGQELQDDLLIPLTLLFDIRHVGK